MVHSFFPTLILGIPVLASFNVYMKRWQLIITLWLLEGSSQLFTALHSVITSLVLYTWVVWHVVIGSMNQWDVITHVVIGSMNQLDVITLWLLEDSSQLFTVLHSVIASLDMLTCCDWINESIRCNYTLIVRQVEDSSQLFTVNTQWLLHLTCWHVPVYMSSVASIAMSIVIYS